MIATIDRSASALPPIAPAAEPTRPLQTFDLGRRFGRQWALAHLDLAVEAGEVVLLVGANGAGKTTALRLIAGLLRPSAGRIRVGEHEPWRDRLACRRQVSFLSHDSYLYDRLSAAEMVALWARLRGVALGGAERRALLARAGLEDSADAAIGGFSAGMRKRLALARLRLGTPRVVLLDEPFAALDEPGKEWVEGWIREARRDRVAVVLASHEIERAAALADRCVWLRQGQAYWRGPAADLPALYRDRV